MKKLLFCLLLSCIYISSFAQQTKISAIYSYRTQLNEGKFDSLNLESYYKHYEQCKEEFKDRNDCSLTYINESAKQANVQSWSNENRTLLNNIIEFNSRNVDRLYAKAEGYEEWQFLIHKLRNELVKSKIFRDFAYGQVCNHFVNSCKIYPKSFRVELLDELSKMINAVKAIPSGKYELVQENNNGWVYDVFYINAQPDWQFGRTNEAFALRRYFKDNISQEELLNKLTNLHNRIKAVDNSTSKDEFYAVLVNNSFYFTIRDGKAVITPTAGGTSFEFTLWGNQWSSDFYTIKKVNNKYYLIGKKRNTVLNAQGKVISDIKK